MVSVYIYIYIYIYVCMCFVPSLIIRVYNVMCCAYVSKVYIL